MRHFASQGYIILLPSVLQYVGWKQQCVKRTPGIAKHVVYKIAKLLGHQVTESPSIGVTVGKFQYFISFHTSPACAVARRGSWDALRVTKGSPKGAKG